MPQKNGYRSHRGRSAVARAVSFGGTNGIMPAVYVTTTTGDSIRSSYFGGPKKGGSAPSATGFMIAKSTPQAFNASAHASRPNLLFNFRQFSSSPNGIGGPL
jgi:hypothetical protein